MAALIPELMSAVALTGHGGFNHLHYVTDAPVPRPSADEVLIEVGASAVNNTDINTRLGWYSRNPDADDKTAWSGSALAFPRIQGADCCGRIVAVGSDVDATRVGERVLVRTMQDPDVTGTQITLGSEIDGAFAQYVAVRSSEAFAIDSTWTDGELASLPCSYSTAEGLLHRAGVSADERVLITGASGGVGSAAVQLAKRRGAHVTAIAHPDKKSTLLDIGADVVLARGVEPLSALPANSIDAVIDVVGGSDFPDLLTVLRPRGRYAVSGAVAGPHVDLDLRDLYLKDLTLLGCTFHERAVFENLVGYVERNEIRPLIAATYPLAEIVAAQERFLAKDFVGKIVLVPPQP